MSDIFLAWSYTRQEFGFHTLENRGVEETGTVETDRETPVEDIGGRGAVPMDLVVLVDLGGGGAMTVV